MISIYFLNIFCMNFDVGIRSTGGQKSHRPLPGSWTYKKQKWESKFLDSLWEFSCLCGKSKDFMLCMVCHQGNCKLKPHLLEWPKSRTQTTAGAGEDVEPRELSLVAGGDAKCPTEGMQPLWKTFGSFLQNGTLFLCRCCSVAKLCLILCDPMGYSTPGFPVHHQLPGLAQTLLSQWHHPTILSSSSCAPWYLSQWT